MYRIALVGNPNTGKTTIFNALSGENEKTGNYQGVTVAEKTSRVKALSAELVDLPGIYALNAYSMEEKISENFISKNKNAIYLNIIESSNFNRSISLTKSLLDKGLKVILVLNMYDELIKSHGAIDILALTKALKIPIIAINANDKKDIKRLIALIKKSTNLKPVKTSKIELSGYFSPPKLKESVIDKLLFNKVFCVFSFIAILFIIFAVTFFKNSLGDIAMRGAQFIVEKSRESLGAFLSKNNCPVIIKSFILNGVISGIGSVLCFLPQLVLLYFFITALEESGYMARIAFMLDGLLSKIGLSGRAVFSLVIGFGCTAIAELSTRSFDNKNMQKKVSLILPFVSCSARLPIYMVILNAYFLRYKIFLLLGIYLLGISLSIVTSALLNKYFFKLKQTFIMEMPTLRFINAKRLIKVLINYIKQFIIRIGGIIILVMSALWLLQNFSLTFKFLAGENIEKSILAQLGKIISYIFYPIGIKDWKIAVSIVSGLFAKEAVVGSLTQLFPQGLEMTSLEALSFLVFCSLYTPCFSALFVMKKEIGGKLTIISAVMQFLLALLITFIVNLIGGLSLRLNIWIILLFLAVTALLLINLLKKKCNGNCKRCKIR